MNRLALIIRLTGMALALIGLAARAEDEVGTEYGVFEIGWPQRSLDEVASRATRAASVMTGQDYRLESFIRAIEAGIAEGSWAPQPVPGVEGILVGYDWAHDDLRVFNDTIPTEAGPDIGEGRAREVFLRAMERLQNAGLADIRYYQFDNPVVSLELLGAGRTDVEEPVTVQTLQYRYMALRAINRVPFLNAGIRIAVHRSGEISGIRLGGAEVRSEGPPGAESPIGAGSMIRREVTGSELQELFYQAASQDGAQVRLDSSQFAYLVPDDMSTLAEPLHRFTFSHAFESAEGVSVSRGLEYAFRVDATGGPLYDLTPRPNPGDQADAK